MKLPICHNNGYQVILLGALVLTGCAPSDTEQPSPEETVAWTGVSLPTLDDPFMRKLADSIENAASRAGFELRVVSADRDSKQQTAQLEAFIDEAASAVVVWPCDCDVIQRQFSRAHAADIAVFTLGPIQPDAEANVIAHLGPDEHGGAREAVRVLVDALGKKGKVAILSHPESTLLGNRVEAFREQLALYRDLSLAGLADGGRSREEARRETKKLLEKFPQLDAILAADQILAIGAVEAVRQGGKTDQMKIMAFGDGREIRQAVKRGELHGTMLRAPKRLGEKVVEAVTRYLDDEEVPSQILVPCRPYLQPDAAVDTTLVD